MREVSHEFWENVSVHTCTHMHNTYTYVLKFMLYYQVRFQNSEENTKLGEIKIRFYHSRNLRT